MYCDESGYESILVWIKKVLTELGPKHKNVLTTLITSAWYIGAFLIKSRTSQRPTVTIYEPTTTNNQHKNQQQGHYTFIQFYCIYMLDILEWTVSSTSRMYWIDVVHEMSKILELCVIFSLTEDGNMSFREETWIKSIFHIYETFLSMLTSLKNSKWTYYTKSILHEGLKQLLSVFSIQTNLDSCLIFTPWVFLLAHASKYMQPFMEKHGLRQIANRITAHLVYATFLKLDALEKRFSQLNIDPLHQLNYKKLLNNNKSSSKSFFVERASLSDRFKMLLKSLSLKIISVSNESDIQEIQQILSEELNTKCRIKIQSNTKDYFPSVKQFISIFNVQARFPYMAYSYLSITNTSFNFNLPVEDFYVDSSFYWLSLANNASVIVFFFVLFPISLVSHMNVSPVFVSHIFSSSYYYLCFFSSCFFFGFCCLLLFYSHCFIFPRSFFHRIQTNQRIL